MALVQHRAQIDPLASQLDSVLRDAGDVEQIVGDAHQVQELALHRGARLLDELRIGAASRMISTAVRIGARGLRSSCDSVARNSSFRRSASRSAISASFRSVRSTQTLTQP